MASRKSKKNNTIFLIVLLLLLLLIGWLLWRIMASPAAPRPTSTQTNSTSAYTNGTQPSSYYNNPNSTTVPAMTVPSISFSMPPEQSRTVTSATTAPDTTTVSTAPAASTQRVTRTDFSTGTTPAPSSRASSTTSTQRRPASSTTSTPRQTTSVATTTSSPTATTFSTPRAPTRPTRPASSATPGMAGSPIDGMAIVRGKSQDQNSGKYYLFCASDRTTLNYVYEVDGATFYEANPGLMFNPAKIANWKFVSSQ